MEAKLAGPKLAGPVSVYSTDAAPVSKEEEEERRIRLTEPPPRIRQGTALPGALSASEWH